MVDRELGFSLWLDFVERDFLQNEFASLIERGIINGATSNPAIFASAITTSRITSYNVCYTKLLRKIFQGTTPVLDWETTTGLGLLNYTMGISLFGMLSKVCEKRDPRHTQGALRQMRIWGLGNWWPSKEGYNSLHQTLKAIMPPRKQKKASLFYNRL